jgi:hypothetical protein
MAMIKHREANKILKEMTTDNYLDANKVKLHPRRNDILLYLVRGRLPITPEMVGDEETAGWLITMGYMYCFSTPKAPTMICNGDWYARSVVETGKSQPLNIYNWEIGG